MVARSEILKDLVTEARSRSGKTIRGFASLLEVTHSTVARWESGNGKISRDGVRRIADILSCSPEQVEQCLDGDIAVRDLLDGTSPQSSPRQQIIRLLKGMSFEDRIAVAKSALEQQPDYPQTSAELAEGHGEADILKRFINSLIEGRSDDFSIDEIAAILGHSNGESLRKMVSKIYKNRRANCVIAKA